MPSEDNEQLRGELDPNSVAVETVGLEQIRSDIEALAARDPDIARAYAEIGCPERRNRPAGFATLLRIIVSQQLSVAAVAAIIARLENLCSPLAPEPFLALSEQALRDCGLSLRKVEYGRSLAEKISTGHLDLVSLSTLDDEQAIAQLTALRGIGRWTAEIYLLFSLERTDIWPEDDLALQISLQRLKQLPTQPNRRTMRAYGEAWRPWRSAGARFLWHYYRKTPVV